MRVRPQDRPASTGARRTRHLARLIEACRAMLAIDEDRIRLQLSEAPRQSRGDMVGVYHQNMLARSKALAQFRSDHLFLRSLSGFLLQLIRAWPDLRPRARRTTGQVPYRRTGPPSWSGPSPVPQSP